MIPIIYLYTQLTNRKKNFSAYRTCINVNSRQACITLTFFKFFHREFSKIIHVTLVTKYAMTAHHVAK